MWASSHQGKVVRMTSSPARYRVSALASALVALLMATLGRFVVQFPAMTACTNTFDCSETSCPPCHPMAGWFLTGALLQYAIGLGCLALYLTGDRLMKGRVVSWAVALGAVVASVLVMAITTELAGRSAPSRPAVEGDLAVGQGVVVVGGVVDAAVVVAAQQAAVFEVGVASV